MKKEYVKPNTELLEYDPCDIISTSTDNSDDLFTHDEYDA